MKLWNTNILHNAYFSMGMLTLICCLITDSVVYIGCDDSELYTAGTISMLVAGVITFAMLFAATYVIITKKPLKRMNAKAETILDIVKMLLFIYWFVMLFFPAATPGIWFLPILAILWIACLAICGRSPR